MRAKDQEKFSKHQLKILRYGNDTVAIGDTVEDPGKRWLGESDT